MDLKTKILMEAVANNEFTIACVSCHKPLWLIHLKGKYGTRNIFDATPFDGVPDYKDYWEADQRTAKRTDCPHCAEPYLKAIKHEGHVFARPFVLEFDKIT